MASVNHSVVMSTTHDKLINSLTTLQGLSSWWTKETSGSTNVGDVIEFRFGGSGFDMKVLKSNENSVLWEVIAGPDEWIGTRVNFDIRNHEKGVILYFAHTGWEEESEFHHHCSMKWATFLLSLKDYLEKGAGKPYPDDG